MSDHARGPFVDASGTVVILSGVPQRIVSLVPSVTEILFTLGVGPAVAGCTVYCTQPPDGVATVTRVGGEKNPKLELIRDLGADLVIANIEENLREHVATLRSWGIAVYVTYPRTVPEGIRLIVDLGALTGAAERGAALGRELVAQLSEVEAATRGRRPARVFYPIWRHPYMTIGVDTYAHDMLARCGGVSVFANRAERYPTVTLDELAAAAPEVILLPDEPYRFRRAHVADFEAYPEMPAVRDRRIHLLDGKLLTWYGPRIAEALRELPALLRGAR